jgi:putative drug exporter of the RND superfamily
MQPRNVTARAVRWSARHRRKAIFGRLAFVPAATVIGAGVGMNTIDHQDQDVGQVRHADQLLKQAGSKEVQRWLRM